MVRSDDARADGSAEMVIPVGGTTHDDHDFGGAAIAMV
jgi:hypothetical protein